MEPVSCSECRYFIRDKIGDGNGIGQCKMLEEYKAKGASKKAIDKAFIMLGNKVFWGGDGRDRYCDKYKAI